MQFPLLVFIPSLAKSKFRWVFILVVKKIHRVMEQVVWVTLALKAVSLLAKPLAMISNSKPFVTSRRSLSLKECLL